MRSWLKVVTLLLVAPATAAEPGSAQAVLDCAAANAPERSFEQVAAMKVFQNEQLQREILATFAGQRARGDFLLNIGVREPADLAGTAVLLRQDESGRDDMKLYLPALRRVRRVTGAMAGQELLGTDFSYHDIRQVYGSFSAEDAELLESQQWQERAMYRVALKPEEGVSDTYQSIIVGIDKQVCTPLVIDFIGEKGATSKRLEGDFDSLLQVGERHLLARYTMRNLSKGSRTELDLGSPQFDERVSRSAFNPNTFYNFHSRADAPQ